MSEHTRRATLKAAGATLAVAAVPATARADSHWQTAETPVQTDLHDVADTANGPYAVGGGGDVIARSGGSWTKVLDGGPAGNGNPLRGADTTDDGERLWFVGNSGAVGEYDVTTGSLFDHSNPLGTGDNLTDVTVTGAAGEANVYVTDASGHLLYSTENGEQGEWHDLTPGSGAALTAIDFFGTDEGHVVDTNQKAFVTDNGAAYDTVGIGNAGINFYGVDSDGVDDVWVCGGNGTLFHYNGDQWVKTNLGDANLRDVNLSDDDADGYTVGAGGAVFDRTDGQWTRDSTPTGANLHGVLRGDPDIAVGASGTVIESSEGE